MSGEGEVLLAMVSLQVAVLTEVKQSLTNSLLQLKEDRKRSMDEVRTSKAELQTSRLTVQVVSSGYVLDGSMCSVYWCTGAAE